MAERPIRAVDQGASWQLRTTSAVLPDTVPQFPGVPRTRTGSPGFSEAACNVGSSVGRTQTSSLGRPSIVGAASLQPMNRAA